MDLIPQWERSFSLTFNQSDFAQVSTVGEMVWAVERRLAACRVQDENLGCSSQRVFYWLRRMLADLGFSPDALTPDTQLQELLPLKNRRKIWKQMQAASRLPLPELGAPFSLFFGLWAVATVGVWTAAPTGWLAGLVGLCFAIVAYHWPFVQVCLPVTTLGALATRLVHEHYHSVNPGYINPHEVRRMLLADLAAYGAVDPKELGPATKLVW